MPLKNTKMLQKKNSSQTSNFVDENIMGISLREPHYSDYQQRKNKFNGLEVVFENYLFTQGERREILQDICQDAFVHLHGVSLNIGSFDPLNIETLQLLKNLSVSTKAKIISDHLSFTRINGKSSFELLPIPKTKAMLDHLADRINQVQDILGQPLLLENISTYFRYSIDEMTEFEFMLELHNKCNVNFLLDVNNVFVTCQNLGIDPTSSMKKLPKNCVGAYHIGGFEVLDNNFYFDTHGAAVSTEVQGMYREAIQYFGIKPTFLERDENIPYNLADLENELERVLNVEI